MAAVTKRMALAALTSDAEELNAVRRKLKQLKALEIDLVDNIKMEMETLGKEAFEVEGYTVAIEHCESSILDRELLVKKVGEKVLEQCKKVKAYTKVKVSKIKKRKTA